MGQTFTAEMQAIERLFQHGQNDLAYLRQARLIGIQAQYAQELEDIRSGNEFFAGLGEALGQILTVSTLFAINPGLGAAVAAGG
jgi:hypothetical protein